ncbi:hypothetical protein [Nocardia sp. NBC_01327]|uniref:hypothetical protein n=1 Tax=Nocardia sp. NBC_01327 TaxID=2903593 RepID=UPI002E12FC0A|nr:hypothetical protein OG326_24220 [Nocardia sp. NBC_01327]
MNAVATHVVVKTDAGPDVDSEYMIECLTEGGCGGWHECSEPHKVDGQEVTPDDCEPGLPWEGVQEWEFHGVLHTWQGWNGWTIPYVGCIIAVCDWEPPEEVEKLSAGRYPVVEKWGDTDVYLSLAVESPLACGGGQ